MYGLFLWPGNRVLFAGTGPNSANLNDRTRRGTLAGVKTNTRPVTLASGIGVEILFAPYGKKIATESPPGRPMTSF